MYSPIVGHGNIDERRRGNGHHLDVECELTRYVAENPLLIVDEEKHLRRHRERADGQITDS